VYITRPHDGNPDIFNDINAVLGLYLPDVVKSIRAPSGIRNDLKIGGSDEEKQQVIDYRNLYRGDACYVCDRINRAE
jgi:hypothetical protein